MITLIYASSAVEEMNSDELLTLLEKAKSNNQQLDVTGMLLYQGGNFLQVLEGEAEVVESLYDKIAADDRHRGVMTIMKRKIKQREFTDWKMGFANLDTVSAEEMPEGYSDFLIGSGDQGSLADRPSYAYLFLKNFRDLMR